MKVSVIILAHNEEKNIEKAIKSANNQDYKNYEVIVVENGSSDKTFQIAKKFCKKFYSLKEGDYAKSRNLGAKKATGDLLIFLDGDSILPANFISEAVELRKNNFMMGKARISPNLKKISAKVVCEILNHLKYRAWGNMFVDKKFYWKIGGSNPDMKMVDEEMAIRAARISNLTKTKSKVITDMENFENKGYLNNLIKWLSINPLTAKKSKQIQSKNEKH